MCPRPQNIPAELIHEIALGATEPVDIAARFGIGEDDFRALEQQGWFQREVANRRAEYEACGLNLRRRFAANAQVLLEQIYLQALVTDDATTKLDVAKYLAKLADMEPKNNAPVLPAGGGFSITINMGEPKQRVHQNTSARTYDEDVIKVEPAATAAPPVPLAHAPFESLSVPGRRGR